MDEALSRLKLYLLSGEVALMNQALPQADSLFKTGILYIYTDNNDLKKIAIKLIQEVPPKIGNYKLFIYY